MGKPTRKPRIFIRDDGLVVLAGVNYQDLKATFTAAALYRYSEEEKVRRDDTSEDAARTRVYHEEQRKILDLLEKSMSDAIAATFPPRAPMTQTQAKAARFAHVREEKRFRKKMDAFFAEMDAESA